MNNIELSNSVYSNISMSERHICEHSRSHSTRDCFGLLAQCLATTSILRALRELRGENIFSVSTWSG